MIYLDVSKTDGKSKQEDDGDTGTKTTYPQPYWD
jgi:hypothetical protein